MDAMVRLHLTISSLTIGIAMYYRVYRSGHAYVGPTPSAFECGYRVCLSLGLRANAISRPIFISCTGRASDLAGRLSIGSPLRSEIWVCNAEAIGLYAQGGPEVPH